MVAPLDDDAVLALLELIAPRVSARVAERLAELAEVLERDQAATTTEDLLLLRGVVGELIALTRQLALLHTERSAIQADASDDDPLSFNRRRDPGRSAHE